MRPTSHVHHSSFRESTGRQPAHGSHQRDKQNIHRKVHSFRSKLATCIRNCLTVEYIGHRLDHFSCASETLRVKRQEEKARRLAAYTAALTERDKLAAERSEERRVGNECGSRWWRTR